MKNLVIWPFMAFLLACTNPSLPDKSGSKPPSHAIWNGLLHRHVSAAGKVDYLGFRKESLLLNQYLDSLSQHPPDQKAWSRTEQLAYWINAYNAFTVKLIVDHYPVKSIQDLHPKPYVPLVNTVWHIKFFQIGGRDFNLDQIEHAILRKQFDEPRLHFAIVCASVSCPPLRNEAYLAEKMDEQLDSQARTFINDPTRNQLQPNQVRLSQIFSWFTGDFTKKESLIAFLNRYATVKISSGASVDYLDYNWDLNE
jgi:hypothetical protein